MRAAFHAIATENKISVYLVFPDELIQWQANEIMPLFTGFPLFLLLCWCRLSGRVGEGEEPEGGMRR
jgi:hypothetical protein